MDKDIQKILDEQRKKSDINKVSDGQINKIIANTIKNKSDTQREIVRKTHLGKKRTEQSKLKMSEVQKELCKNRTPTHLFDPIIHEKAINKQRGVPRPQTSAKLKGKTSKLKGSVRPNLSNALKGKSKSEEHVAKMRKPKIKSECPHCKMWVAPNIMSRFHNDNCKSRHP